MTGRETAADRIPLLLSLRAVRKFRGYPVPRGVVDDVLEVARRGTLSRKPLSEIVHEERYG